MTKTATATFRTKPELKSRVEFLAKETHRKTIPAEEVYAKAGL